MYINRLDRCGTVSHQEIYPALRVHHVAIAQAIVECLGLGELAERSLLVCAGWYYEKAPDNGKATDYTNPPVLLAEATFS